MDSLKNWSMLVCSTAVVCTVLYRLFPDNSLGKQGRLLLPCVFLCVIVSPLLMMDWSLPPLTPSLPLSQDPPTLEARIRQQTVERVNDTLLDMVNQALDSYGYEAKKIATDVDITDDGSIDMGQIVVYVDEETAARSSLIKQVAQERLGMVVTVAKWEAYG